MNTTTNTRGVSEAMASRIGKDLQNPLFWLDVLKTNIHTTDCPERERALSNAEHFLRQFCEAALSAPEPAAQGEARPKAFGIACTVAWTELHNAMAADGMNPPAKCGKATREWIEGVVQNEFASHAPPAQPAERVPYCAAIGEAGEKYHAQFKHAHPLPATWRWEDLWNAMLTASPAPSEGGKGVDDHDPPTCPICDQMKLSARCSACGYEDLTAAQQAAR